MSNQITHLFGHADAAHNVVNRGVKIHDPLLTTRGEKQAAKIIETYFAPEHANVDTRFSSSAMYIDCIIRIPP